MLIVRTISELKKVICNEKKNGKSIGFVPTMGYLHEGHMSLIEEAKKQDDIIVLSIFVNPLQFGPNEDFDRYPRDFERDENLAKNKEVDIIFYPDVVEMYPREMTATVSVHNGINVLCGKSRPGHFDGVATVVLKLFNIVQPTRAYFGMKDAQQVAVIENIVKDFNLPVEIKRCPTLREEDGLARSSRNVYLTSSERLQAPEIYRGLQAAIASIHQGEKNTVHLIKQIETHLTEKTEGTIDYIEILSYPDLEAIEHVQGKIIIAVALKFSKARLIDNIIFSI